MKNLDIKAILKTLKLNESTISAVLGAVVILAVGILVLNYFRERRGSVSLPGQSVIQETSQTTTKMHSVKKGETLWLIAENYFGSGYNWVDIAKENNLPNPNLIEEGQELTIPQVETKKVVAEESDSQAISGASYTVERGDNLWNIAVRAYADGFKWVDIARENKLTNPNLIHPGNAFVIPR